MSINYESFTPLMALEGGLIIGVAVSLLLLLNGRTAGISGIFGELFNFKTKDKGWRLAFVLGLILSPIIYKQFVDVSLPLIQANNFLLEISGLLVGLGTRFASGCTSGHGVCGLSRLSLRSLAATILFIFAGVVTVFITRHVLG